METGPNLAVYLTEGGVCDGARERNRDNVYVCMRASMRLHVY